MVSIREYAEKNGISYETVRRQIKRYAAELSGHIEMQGSTRYLDSEAVAFLNGKRASNAVQVVSGDPEQERELLAVRQQKEELQAKVEEMGAELTASAKEIGDLKNKLIQQQETIISLQQQIIEMQRRKSEEDKPAPEEETTAAEGDGAPDRSEEEQAKGEDLREESHVDIEPEEEKVSFWKRIFSFRKH